MNRPQKIKEVYRELRMVLGDEYSDHELFKSASLLIEVLSDDIPIGLDQFEKFERKHFPRRCQDKSWIHLYLRTVER